MAPLGLKVAYAPAGIAVAMAFTSLPFVVRSLKPVIEDLDPAEEEAALSLGAGEAQTFWRVLVPALQPALATGCAMAFARALSEYGAIIFIAGNVPLKTEVTTLLTYIRLEEFDYAGAAALATALLGLSFFTLFVVNALQLWRRRREARG
ncbi:ABC transporter permease subunit [Phenylobacterium sp. LjRoot219]|uniref:ABC transporter permease n=1 Tax=Phenylobacterium sp. LjRoot219 TaxID=3342283 RepID=UPI003ECE72E0